jgi:hypothetical protein
VNSNRVPSAAPNAWAAISTTLGDTDQLGCIKLKLRHLQIEDGDGTSNKGAQCPNRRSKKRYKLATLLTISSATAIGIEGKPTY